MKKISWLDFPYHPFLLAAFPVLSLLADNIVEITFKESLRSFAWFLGGALLFFLLFWALARSAPRAGLAASFLVVMFTTFGDGYARLKGAVPQGSPLGQANVAAALWSIPMILGTWALLRVVRNPIPLARIANVVGLAALLGALAPLGMYAGRVLAEGPIPVWAPEAVPLRGGENVGADEGQKPDVYYIILDGYGRSDSLKEFHHVDNSRFLQFLESRGFTIAGQSSTNYVRTMLSLSSSLNFNYLDQLMEVREGANNYEAYRALIKDNAVMGFFHRQGYRTVALSTGFEITEVSGADVFLHSQKLSYFEETLLARTLAVFWVDRVVGDYRRAEITQAFANLRKSVELPGPKFVFAHLIVPHPPFVFDENGGPLDPRGWGDGTTYAGGREHYLQNYRRQVQYVDTVVEQVVAELQEKSATPPVIIIQGDHGPGAYVDWMDWRKTCLRERLPILNAYYLPGVSPADIPQDITPVNTFRLVLDRYFGEDLPLLPNRMYTVEIPRPYNYIEVTAADGTCPARQSAAGGVPTP